MNATHTETRYGAPWSREELVLALYLYCQIPFAQTKSNNPEVRRLAQILGRTPSSVARKLGNFGAFDPVLAARGLSGLKHFGRLDKEVWYAYAHRWEHLVRDSSSIMASRLQPELQEVPDVGTAPILSLPSGPTERSRTVVVRTLQAFFRRAVISSYRNSCCVCGLNLPDLLVASHIVPWSVDRNSRVDPQNGLCLCALHDRAFDRGLLSVDSDLRVVVSSLVGLASAPFARVALLAFGGSTVRLPDRFPPEGEKLAWHLSNVFRP